MLRETSKSYVITESRQILGLIREILFVRTVAQVVVGDESRACVVHDIEETSPRDRSGERYLILKTENETIPISLEEGTPVSVEFGFGRFKARFSAKVVRQIGVDIIRTGIPKEVEISDFRQSVRANLSKEVKFTVPVLITQGIDQIESTFYLDNISKSGLGGELVLPDTKSLERDAVVQGIFRTGESSFPVRATVVRVFESETDLALAGRRYRVGLKFSVPAYNGLGSSKKSRAKRAHVDEHIVVTSLLDPSTSLKLGIVEASASGFKARIRGEAGSVAFPLGSPFSIREAHLFARLIRVEDESLYFEIIGGSEPNRLKWLNALSPYLHINATSEIRSAREVLNIFCEAGALSGKFLNSHSSYSSEILSGFERSASEYVNAFRWICKSPVSGKPIGHISAVKYGDCSWLMGDIAGSPDQSDKLPSDFIAAFFETFKHFSLLSRPVPKHLIMWVVGHPYWKRFEEYLASNGRKNLIANALTAYTRLEDMSMNEQGTKVTATEIIATEFKKINFIQSQLKAAGLELFSRTLDFSEEGFGSNQLGAAFSEAGHFFYRRYFSIVTERSSWLLILSNFPMGLSFNRVPESAWLFPVASEKAWSVDWLHIKRSIHELALLNGIKLPSIRRFVAEGEVPELLVGESVTLRCVLCHPEVWDFYGEEP
jgi:hypothetical protein